MIITWDETKRRKTIEDRGLDFADATLVFAGHVLEFEDTRADYGETRMVTVGRLGGRMVIVVWTPRGAERRIVSMRKANDRENARYGQRLG